MNHQLISFKISLKVSALNGWLACRPHPCGGAALLVVLCALLGNRFTSQLELAPLLPPSSCGAKEGRTDINKSERLLTEQLL